MVLENKKTKQKTFLNPDVSRRIVASVHVELSGRPDSQFPEQHMQVP